MSLIGIQTPGRAEADEIGGLADARFLDIAVNVVHLAPARPAAPEHVEHLVVLRLRIVPGEEFEGQAQLVVQLSLNR